MPILAKAESCTGCMSCYNACRHDAIEIRVDKDGFLCPSIDNDKCVDCKLCELSCPVVTTSSAKGNDAPKAYALWCTKDRTLSSSGGAFSAFARNIIAKGGVVFGAVYDEELNLYHTEVSTVEGLTPMRGSKYIQSNIGTTFRKVREYLRNDRYVLFCGTPCQIDGLKSFLRKDYEKLFLLDIACHGVPSNGVFQSYKKKLEHKLGMPLKGQKVVNFSFRRCDRWDKVSSFTTDNKKWHYIFGVNALFMEAFDTNADFRECCYTCRYSCVPRVGDCSIADFWGLGRHGRPFSHDVMNGVSLVLVNTPKGQKFLDNLEDIFCEERTLEEALIENSNLRKPSRRNPRRNEIIADFLNPDMSLAEIDAKYNLVNHSLKATVKCLASKYGVFDFVKRIYNKYKTL